MFRRALASPREVADFLQVPERTLTEWRYRRVGPLYARVGRHVRYRWDDVEKWLDEQGQAVA
jgi:hypothetical protein